MKIGFDSKRLFNNFTGLGNYSRTLVKNLYEYFPDNDYYLYTPNIQRTSETNFFLENTGFHSFESTSLFKSFWRTYSIVQQLKKDSIELYHGLSHEIPVGLYKSGIKSVVTIHDLIFKIYPSTYNYSDRKIYHMKIKYSCSNANRIIAISNNTKKDIIRLYGIDPDKIDVIYQTCNQVYFEPLTKEDTDKVLDHYHLPSEYLVCVGTVEKRKNLKLIIDAYKYLGSANKAPLVIIGKGKVYLKEIMRHVKAEGLDKYVYWITDLSNNRHLHAIYSRSLAMIYPSKYEGFGLPIVEALFSQTPVITSNVSSLPESVGPASLLIDPDNPVELAQSIEKVLNDSFFRESMIHSGYDYAVRNFSPEKKTKEIMKCYLKTVQNG